MHVQPCTHCVPIFQFRNLKGLPCFSLTSYRKTRRNYWEPDMLWEHEPRRVKIFINLVRVKNTKKTFSVSLWHHWEERIEKLLICWDHCNVTSLCWRHHYFRANIIKKVIQIQLLLQVQSYRVFSECFKHYLGDLKKSDILSYYSV